MAGILLSASRESLSVGICGNKSGLLKEFRSPPIKPVRSRWAAPGLGATDHGQRMMQVFMGTRQSNHKVRPETSAATEDVHFLIYPLAALNAVLNRTPVDLKRFCGQVALYPGLAQKVLARCQAALPDASVSSIDEALLHLGVERIRILLVTVVLTDYCRLRVPLAAGEAFLQAAEGTARVSESLARMTGYAWPERAYLAGLVHEAGKLLLLPSCSGEADHPGLDAPCGDPAMIERAQGGSDSAELDKWLGMQLRLPENVVEAMACHRCPQNARKDPQLVNIVALARWIAQEEIRRGDQGVSRLPENWPGGSRSGELELE